VNSTLSDYPAAAHLLPINTTNCIEALHDGRLFCYLMNCISESGPMVREDHLLKTKVNIFDKIGYANKAL
jgi:hypothetical protein